MKRAEYVKPSINPRNLNPRNPNHLYELLHMFDKYFNAQHSMRILRDALVLFGMSQYYLENLIRFNLMRLSDPNHGFIEYYVDIDLPEIINFFGVNERADEARAALLSL